MFPKCVEWILLLFLFILLLPSDISLDLLTLEGEGALQPKKTKDYSKFQIWELGLVFSGSLIFFFRFFFVFSNLADFY